MSAPTPPGPGATPGQIIEYLRSLSSSRGSTEEMIAASGAAGEWLTSNVSKMDGATADAVVNWYLSDPNMGAGGSAGYGDLVELKNKIDAGKEQAYNLLTSGDNPNFDLDHRNGMDSWESYYLNQAKDRVAKDRAAANNTSVEDERKLVDGQTQVTGDGSSVVWPQWLQGMAGGQISDEQMAALVEHWNELHPDDTVATSVELMQRMQAQTLDVNIVAQDVLLGTDPDPTYTIRLADGSVAFMQRSDFEKMQGVTGGDLDTTEVNRLFRLADEVGMSRTVSSAGPDGRPLKEVDWKPAMVLANALGVTNLAIDKTARKNGAARGQQGPDAGLPTSRQEQYVSDIYKLRNALVAYQFNYATYNGHAGLAYLGTLDSALASRIAATPWVNLSLEDRSKANSLLIQGGLVQSDQTNDAGLTSGAELLDMTTAQNTGGGGGGGGGGYSRTLPDPVAVKQAARDMYQSLFIAEPDEAQLQQFVAIVNSQISSAPSNQSVDASARLRDILEGNALYKEFYGKAGGLSDGEYQQQFRSGAQSMLGAEAADPNAVLGGMRTGNYQTTIGQVAGSQKAWGNSTFLGRLAQAASVVNENT